MNNSKHPTADDVYTSTKRAIDGLARHAFELAKQRAPRRVEGAREKEAFDALEDVRQVAAELCTLWDALWESISQGRPDPVTWSNVEFESLDPEEDTWLLRHEQEKARNARRQGARDRDDVEGSTDDVLDDDVLDELLEDFEADEVASGDDDERGLSLGEDVA